MKPYCATAGRRRGARSAALDVTEHLRKEKRSGRPRRTQGHFPGFAGFVPESGNRGLILDYHGPKRLAFWPRARSFPQAHSGPGCTEAGRHIEKAIERVRKTSSMIAIEFCLPTQGEDVCFEARLIPLHWKEIIVIVRDITERRHAEKRLQQYAEECRRRTPSWPRRWRRRGRPRS